MSLLLVRKDGNIILIPTWLNSEVWLCELNPVSTILNWNSSFALDLFVRFKMIQELFPRHNFYLISYQKYVQGTLRASEKFLNSNFTKYSQCSVKFTILLKKINRINPFCLQKFSKILMTFNFNIKTTVKCFNSLKIIVKFFTGLFVT